MMRHPIVQNKHERFRFNRLNDRVGSDRTDIDRLTVGIDIESKITGQCPLKAGHFWPITTVLRVTIGIDRIQQ